MHFSRRDFLKVVFATIPVAAIDGPLAALWPASERQREVGPPFEIFRDSEGYLCDPGWDYDAMERALPTPREALVDPGWSAEEIWRWAVDRFEIDEEDPAEVSRWKSGRLEAWLDRPIEFEDLGLLGAWRAMEYTEHWPGARIFLEATREDLWRFEAMGLELVEGDHPGSSFFGARFRGDVEAFNRELARAGMNLEVAW